MTLLLTLSTLTGAHASSQPYITSHGVNFAIGNKYLVETDLSINGPVGTLEFKRTYNSRSTVNGILGYGWSGPATEHLEIDGTSIIRVLSTGKHIAYEDDGSGDWVSQLGKLTTITEVGGGYELKKSDETVITYDTEGKLLQIQHKNGYTQSLSYTGTQLTAIADNFGKTLTFAYDTAGKLATLTGPTGSFTFAYTDDNLVSVTRPDSSGRQYLYEDANDPHNVTGVVDEAGIQLNSVTYDAYDRVVTSSVGGNQQLTIAYSTSMTRTVTDSDGNSTTYQLEVHNGVAVVAAITGPGCSSCGGSGANSSYTYNNRQQVASVTNGRGYTTSYTYDDNGNRASVTRAAGEPEESTITYTYDQTTNRISSISEQSVVDAGQQHVTSMTYDPNGNLLSRSESGYNGLLPISRTTTYTYNSYGQLLSIDGPRLDANDITAFGYYPNNEEQGCNRGYLHTVTNALGQVTTYSDYNELGKPEQITDPNAVVTTMTYDANGHITTRTTGTRTISYQYDSAGRLDAITLPENKTLDYQYNGGGLLDTILDSDGNYIRYEYDAVTGKLSKRSIFSADDTLRTTVEYQYDSYGRLHKQINPDQGQSFTEKLYDDENNLVSLLDELSNETTYTYDGLNRLITVTQPGDVVTGIAYDIQGNQIEIVDDNNNSTTYVYGDFGRKVQEQSPDTGTTTFEYDEADNLVSKIDSNLVATVYTYDALNRLTKKHFPQADQNILYLYDQGTFGIGHLTAMTDGDGSSIYSYNQYKEMVAEERQQSGRTFSTGYQYNGNSEVTAITYPSGRVITYTRNNDGRVTAVSSSYQGVSETLAANISHPPFGPMATMDLGNGISVSRAYDLQYRLTSAVAGTVYNRDNTYLDTGQVATITDNLNPSLSQSFGYNALQMLTSATGNYGNIGYTYDGVGNRLEKTTDGISEPYSYMAGSNKLSQFGDTTVIDYSYDPAGNTTARGAYQFDWDGANRLLSVTTGGEQVASYAYDGNNRRIAKRSAQTTELFIYDSSGHLLAQYPNGSLPYREFVYLDGEPLAFFQYESVEVDLQQVIAALHVASGSPNATAQDITGNGVIGLDDTIKPLNDAVINATVSPYYYINDHLGTAQYITDSAGQLAWAGEYSPFGDVTIRTDLIGNDFRFPGQYYDDETGLHYNWHRFYDPSTGRYISADPIGLDGGINLYAYVDGDPINAIDPEGLAKMCCRLLGNPVAGAFARRKHCYIVADDGTVYGLYPKNGKGVPRTNDPRDRGGKCVECPARQCMDQNQCLKDAHNNYPIGDYSTLGPNSNTYAGSLARSCCKGGVPKGIYYTPGIDDNPPPSEGPN